MSPAAADTLPTTTLIIGPYNLVGSDSVSVAVPGALGSTGTTGSGAYFDYLYEFSISQDSYVTATIGPVDGSAFSEMHMMFYDVTPAGPDESLYTGADVDTLYTDPATRTRTRSTSARLRTGPPPVRAASRRAAGPPPYHLASLSGTYWLRVFGIRVRPNSRSMQRSAPRSRL